MWYSTFLVLLFACVCTARSTSEVSSGSSSAVDSSSGSTGDIYNVCPVVVDFSEEQDNLSNEELKANAADAAMSAYLLSHPNNTLWDYFKIERKQKKEMFKKLPLGEKIKKVVKGVVDFTLDTAIHLAQTIADAIEWIINTIRDPLVGIKQITSFFKEFGKNVKSLWGLMKEDPKETAKNMGGGLLLHITHHPSEFTAETALMIGTGFAVIGGLMHGVEAIFGTMSNMISNILLSVLMFIHAIDDPIYIVTPLVTSIVDTAGKLAAGRIAAYNRFHDFVCCYLEDQEFEVNAPSMDPTKFQEDLVATPVKMQNCSQLLGNYSADTMWETSVSPEDASYYYDTRHKLYTCFIDVSRDQNYDTEFRLVYLANPMSLAVALSISSGVMMFISLVEIFGESVHLLSEGLRREDMSEETATGHGWLSATACFAIGITLIYLIDIVVQEISPEHEMTEVNNLEHVRESMEQFESNKMDNKEPVEILEGQTPQAGYFVKMDENAKKALQRMGVLSALAIGIHNLPEGIATYVGAIQNSSVGISLAVGIGLHNIPEGSPSLPPFTSPLVLDGVESCAQAEERGVQESAARREDQESGEGHRRLHLDTAAIASHSWLLTPLSGSLTLFATLLLALSRSQTFFKDLGKTTVLTVGAGFAVIHGLMHGVEAIFGSMSNIISKVLLSVLMFIHAIDDPIYIVTPLVTSILEQADTLAANGTATVNLLP
ncbi:Zinc/iron permease [Phytophthora cactorum]|nr:Zinc/iron permease [Phytophthora cactorum]